MCVPAFYYGIIIGFFGVRNFIDEYGLKEERCGFRGDGE